MRLPQLRRLLGQAVLCAACLSLVAVYPAMAQPVDAYAPASGGAVADLQMRMDALDRQLREMTGKLEEAQHKAQQAEDALARYKADTDMRIKTLESQPPPQSIAVGEPNPATPPSEGQTTKPPIPMPEDDKAPAPADSPTTKTLGAVTLDDTKIQDAATAYEDAYALLKQETYARAQAGFQAFITAYPDHPLAANASYWYAETYYAQNEFKTASRLFAESYKKYPKGPKAADSVLKLGLSLSGEGKTQDACIAFKQLEMAFKNAAASVLRRAEQEKTKLGCT